MLRNTFLASLVVATAAFAAGATHAQAPATMQPAVQMQLGAALGSRVVRQVMIGDQGNTVELVYDMAPGQPQSRRVLRLENVNGMLRVIYDEAAPTMAVTGGGTVASVAGTTGGMIEITYAR